MKSKSTAGSADKVSDLLAKARVRERLKHTELDKKIRNFHIEKWTDGDEQLPITMEWIKSGIGEILLASTKKGICFLGFGDEHRDFTLGELKLKFPGNKLVEGKTDFHDEAILRIEHPEKDSNVHLHLKGSDFEIKVWEKILRVPFGGFITYGALADTQNAARAAGNAVGANPVCLIIGCHRVVHSDGDIGGFHYGDAVKTKLLLKEIK